MSLAANAALFPAGSQGSKKPLSDQYHSVSLLLMHKIIRLFLSTVLLLSAISSGAGPLRAEEAELSKLPYRMVANIYKVFQSTKENDRIRLQVTVNYSAKATDRSRPIELTLLTGGKSIPLLRNARGELLDFPIQQELWDENPLIQTNQPKGNLTLSGSIHLRNPGQLAETVGWYRAGLRQANEAGRNQAGVFGVLNPSAKKIIISFPEGARSGVTIKEGTNSKALSADTNGRYLVDLGAKSLPDSAILELASEPLTITIEQ